jgi:nicotinamidase-related amidase
MLKFSIDKGDSVLLLVDIQERLLPAMSEGGSVTANCLHLIEISKMYHIPVLVTEQYPKGLGATDMKVRDALPYYEPFEKMSFSCCDNRQFTEKLHGLARKHIILCGMEAHVCVLQTCLDLLSLGFSIHLAKDAVCSRSAENKTTGIELMRDAGAVIACTETLLFQLLKAAGTDEFRSISKRIR